MRQAQLAQLFPVALWRRLELRPALRQESPVAPQLARALPPPFQLLVARRRVWVSAVRARSVVSVKDLGTRLGMSRKVRSTG